MQAQHAQAVWSARPGLTHRHSSFDDHRAWTAAPFPDPESVSSVPATSSSYLRCSAQALLPDTRAGGAQTAYSYGQRATLPSYASDINHRSSYSSGNSSVGSQSSNPPSHLIRSWPSSQWSDFNPGLVSPPLPMSAPPRHQPSSLPRPPPLAQPMCDAAHSSYSNPEDYPLTTAVHCVLPPVDSLVCHAPSSYYATPPALAFQVAPVETIHQSSAPASYFDHPVSAPTSPTIPSWAPLEPRSQFPTNLLQTPFPPLASPSPYWFSAPNRGAEFVNDSHGGRGREWDHLVSDRAPVWSRADMDGAAWNDQAVMVANSSILARRMKNAAANASSHDSSSSSADEGEKKLEASLRLKKCATGRMVASTSSLPVAITPISRLTGLPTKVLAKRMWPPRDADKRHYFCSWEKCGKAFCRPSARDAHERTHSGDRPFVCPLETCGRGFSVFSNLKRHMFVHPEIDFRGVNSRDLSQLQLRLYSSNGTLQPLHQQYSPDLSSPRSSVSSISLPSTGESPVQFVYGLDPDTKSGPASILLDNGPNLNPPTSWFNLEDDFVPSELEFVPENVAVL